MKFILINSRIPKDTKKQVAHVADRKVALASAMTHVIESIGSIVSNAKHLFADYGDFRLS